jgi:dephospho-CoA kinase
LLLFLDDMSDRTSEQTLPRIIGLTGGVGMGKTTISNHLASTHQIPVLDADVFARAAVEPGSVVLGEIVERYGASILRPDQTLDRQRLGEIIFNSPSERLWLEQRIHPYVRDRMETGLKTLVEQGQTIVVLVVPLLFEARMTDLVTEIWVVRCPLQQQMDRLRQRDRLDIEQARARIDSQMPIERKLDRANVVIDNSTTPEALLEQVDAALDLASPQSTSEPLNSSHSVKN